MNLLPLLLAALPAFAAGEAHQVTVSVANGRTAYEKVIEAVTGTQASFEGNSGSKSMVYNLTVTQDDPKSGFFTVSFQTDISAKKGNAGLAGKTQANAGDGFKTQGSVALRPGMSLTVVQCGGWSVTVGLDAPAKGAKADWDAAGLENARLTLEGTARKCVTVGALGGQSNIMESRAGRGTSKSFIFNNTLSREGAGFLTMFQIDDGIGGYAGGFQSELTLASGRKKAAGQWTFLVEAPKPAPVKKEEAAKAGGQAPATAAAAPGAAPAKKEAPSDAITPGVVPMLR